MRQSLARFSGPESSVRTQFWVDYITTTSGFRFSVHTVGNCTAYAIAKYAALRDAGIAADELRLIIVRIKSLRRTHMVVTVRNFGRWIILDNRSMALVESSELPDYLPLFTLDHRGVRQFVQPTNPNVSSAPCTGACS
jgi:predicted transglutaminase-like cysteine proteinase